MRTVSVRSTIKRRALSQTSKIFLQALESRTLFSVAVDGIQHRANLRPDNPEFRPAVWTLARPEFPVIPTAVPVGGAIVTDSPAAPSLVVTDTLSFSSLYVVAEAPEAQIPAQAPVTVTATSTNSSRIQTDAPVVSSYVVTDANNTPAAPVTSPVATDTASTVSSPVNANGITQSLVLTDSPVSSGMVSTDAALPPSSNATNTGPAASVVGRYVYYGASTYFGDAFAPDKAVLLPGETATAANVTSYSSGITELVIDVDNAAASYTVADFTSRVGRSGDPNAWAAGPAPISVYSIAGMGVNGSTRVFIRWAPGAITNEWLQLTFIPANDTCYMGNLVGEDGGFSVTAATAAATQLTASTAPAPSLTNMYDFNRDGRVDAADELIAQAAVGNSLPVFTAPSSTVAAVSYDWHTQMINGVLNIWAPNPVDFGPTFTVTDPTMLFGPEGVPQVAAVRQGPVSDCYFLAAAGAVAYADPSRIEALVSNDAGGGWAVTFQYENPATGTYTPIVIHTSDQLSSSLQTIADNEVWPSVLEKAYAAFRTWNGLTSQNSMASLNWGYGGSGLPVLNDALTTIYSSGLTQSAFYSTLQNDISAGLPVLYETSSSAPTMVQSHVYIITGVSTDASGTRWVTTYNPWGFYDTRNENDLLANGDGILYLGSH